MHWLLFDMKIVIMFSILLALRTEALYRSEISGPMPDDNFMTLLNPLGPNINIAQLGMLGLAKGKATVEPWSGSYWPIHRGVLAFRYSDKSAYSSKSFLDNYEAFQTKPSDFLLSSGQIDQLSPAEKYDLLIGNSSWALTQAMWKKGLTDYQEKGIVAQWTGICHGWAAISQMPLPPPAHSVLVRDVTNQYSINFYASDIKALLSYLWAESPPETKQAGHRCYQSPVTRDPYLRPVDISCLDTNPMTWHLSVTNRLGRYGKSFVMDSSVGPEVWNYPIASYDYTYFNPRTFQSSHSLTGALEPLSQLTADRYANVRNINTKYVVGIMMDVFHPALSEPTTMNNAENIFQSHSFIYDLELNENLDIIGGEWYSEDQPDFIWTMSEEGRPQIREDLTTFSPWDTQLPLPSDIALSAALATQRGKVMATIVEQLRVKSLE